MPVVIGTMQNTFANPVGLLSDCHRRIESFLSTLLAVASHADGALDMERRNALETALKYFREAAPMHTAGRGREPLPVAPPPGQTGYLGSFAATGAAGKRSQDRGVVAS